METQTAPPAEVMADSHSVQKLVRGFVSWGQKVCLCMETGSFHQKCMIVVNGFQARCLRLLNKMEAFLG